MVDIEKLEQELLQANSEEEFQEILKSNGVEMTMAEIQKMMDEVIPQGELSEVDLDTVAGGFAPWARRGRGYLRMVLPEALRKKGWRLVGPYLVSPMVKL